MEKKNTGVYYVLWAVLACGVVVDILAGIWNKPELFVLAIVLFSWPHTVSSQKIKNAAQDAGKSMKAMKIYAIVLSVIAILLLLNTYIEFIAVLLPDPSPPSNTINKPFFISNLTELYFNETIFFLSFLNSNYMSLYSHHY